MSFKRCRRRYCKCGKLRLPDKSAAVKVLHHLMVASLRDVAPSRVYRCWICCGWHLTSRGRTPLEGLQQEHMPWAAPEASAAGLHGHD